MLARAAESRVRWVRWGLLILWLGLIAILVIDPGTTRFTDPASPHAIAGLVAQPSQVQGRDIPAQPYALGPRLFWGVGIPCVILALVLLGHEGWRRICPLSAVAQIPRWLGIQRRRSVADPAGGPPRRGVALVGPDSWLARNALRVQFALLALGVSLRLTVLSAHPGVLAATFAVIFAAALVVGLLYGGKTWCHFICPMAPVQLVLNGPRGLTGSDPVAGLSQSMCRRPGATGDESTCVGCNAPCPDIDMERTYWDQIGRRDRRWIAYGYLGLVVGFIAFNRLYSGTSDYAASALWSDRDWWAPGWYIAGQVIAVPRLIAAPVTLLVAVALCVLAGIAIEAAMAAGFRRQGSDADRAREMARHRTLTATTVLALGLLLFLVVLPGLHWLGTLASGLIGAVSLAAVAMWAYRTWWRSHAAWQRESLAGTLRRRLAQLPIDLAAHLGGRRLDDLSADEVHVLASVLPQVERGNRRQFYHGVLSDAISSGQEGAAAGRQLLASLRGQLGISDEEHAAIRAGITVSPLAADDGRSLPRALAYQQALERLVLDLVQSGVPLVEALARQESTIRRLREEFAVSAEDEDQALAALGASDGLLTRAARALAAQLAQLESFSTTLASSRPAEAVLARATADQAKAVAGELLAIIEALGDAALPLANELGAPLAAMLADARAGWEGRLSPAVFAALRHAAAPPAPATAKTALTAIAGGADPVLAVLAVHAALGRGLPEAKALGAAVLERADLPASARAGLKRRLGGAGGRRELVVTLAGRVMRFSQALVTVGRGGDCDLSIDLPQVSRRHLQLGMDAEGAWLHDLGGPNGVQVGDRVVRGERVRLQGGERIAFARQGDGAFVVTIETVAEAADDDPIAVFLCLAQAPLLAGLPREELLRLADEGTVRSLASDTVLLAAGDPVERLCIILAGEAVAVVEGEAVRRAAGRLHPGETVGELALLTGRVASATVRADGPLRVASWPAARMATLLHQYPLVAAGLLRQVGERLAVTLGKLATDDSGSHAGTVLIARRARAGEAEPASLTRFAPTMEDRSCSP